MIEADAREFGEGDGENGEIDAGNAEPESQKADDRPADHGNRYRRQNTEPWADIVTHEQSCRDVAAKPDIDRVPERELAGKAHHDVPGLTGIGEVENDDQDGEQIVVDEKRRGQQGGEQCNEEARRPGRQSAGKAPDLAPNLARDLARDLACGFGDELVGHQVTRLPKMPCGRNSKTSTRMAKANMLLADGVNSNPASASVSPISTPPISAPGIEPSPPVITMTKAISA